MVKRKLKKGFSLIELMVVIVVIGILVAIGLPNFISAQDRAKIASVKANMHTVQTAAETYAVDWDGIYPSMLGLPDDGSTGLVREAIVKNYWKDFKNPFTKEEGPGASYSHVPISPKFLQNCDTKYDESGMQVGQVAYNPSLVYESQLQNANVLTESSSNTYNSGADYYCIYGGANYPGRCVSYMGKTFFLSNNNSKCLGDVGSASTPQAVAAELQPVLGEPPQVPLQQNPGSTSPQAVAVESQPVLGGPPQVTLQHNHGKKL